MADLDANQIAADAKRKLKTLLMGAGLTEEMAETAANNSVDNCFSAVIEAITDAITDAGGVGGGGGGGTGDVTGPASATDNALARFDGTTGKAIQGSNATLTDAGWLTVVKLVATADLDVTGATVTGLSASEVGADAAGTAASAVSVHAAAADPHPTYLLETDAAAAYVRRDGSVELTAHWDVGGFKIQGLASGTDPGDAVTYAQLAATLSLAWTASGHTGTTGSIATWSSGNPAELAGSVSGQVLRWSGSAWAASALSASDISTGSVSRAERLGWSKTTSTASTADNVNGTSTNTPSFAVTAGKDYIIEVDGLIECSGATNGWRCRFVESGGAANTLFAGEVRYPTASGTSVDQLTAAGTWTAAGTGTTAKTIAPIRLRYTCSSSGTLTLEIRPEATALVYLHAGSAYRILEL